MKFTKVHYETLSLIYSTEGLSTYFWIKKFLEQSVKIKTSRNVLQVLQYSVLECSTEFYNILLENSSTFEKVPDYFFTF